MASFVKLSNKDRLKLFEALKEQAGSTWDKIYPQYNISRPSLFKYISGEQDIPKELFDEWNKFVHLDINNSNIMNKARYSENKLGKIDLDSELSEIIGIINGDGHLSKLNYEVAVVGNSLEKEYYVYLKELFEKKTNLPFSLKFYGGKFKLRVYSKAFSMFLSQKYRLPLGYKLGKLKIPAQILESDELLRAYIRGLYDTDGCFHVRRKTDPVVVITSADHKYLAEVTKALRRLGFKTVRGDQRVFLYHKEDIDKFFREIKPANSKHLKKYHEYINCMRR